MSDISTVWSPDGSAGDWVLQAHGLQSGSDLESSVLISLFSDATASADDVIPDGTADPRGWWGDLGAQSPIGSKLWLLGRSKATQGLLQTVRQYALDALQWLLDDGVISALQVDAEYVRAGFLGLTVTISQGGGQKLALQYSWVWAGVN